MTCTEVNELDAIELNDRIDTRQDNRKQEKTE